MLSQPIKTLITILVTVVSAERSFSKLEVIKVICNFAFARTDVAFNLYRLKMKLLKV